MEANKCPSTDKLIKKMSHTHKYYSVIKNEILPFPTTWMDQEGIMLSKVSQTKINTTGITYI